MESGLNGGGVLVMVDWGIRIWVERLNVVGSWLILGLNVTSSTSGEKSWLGLEKKNGWVVGGRKILVGKWV